MKCIGLLAAFLVVISLAAARAAAQPTHLAIDHQLGPARITVDAESGFDYRLEAASSLSPAGGWDFLGTLVLDGTSASWLDAQSALIPQRFYRAVRIESAPPEPAQDFRLIDHLGRSQRLAYYLGEPNTRAIVLIFVGNGCTKIREIAPAIRALTNRFTGEGVVFWLIDSNAGDNRSNILAEATSLGFSNGPPILHDAAQLVARIYRAGATPEATSRKGPTRWSSVPRTPSE